LKPENRCKEKSSKEKSTLKHRLVFIGTYTEPILFGTGKIVQGKGEGIYVYTMDSSSGSLELRHIAPAGPNPSYFTFDPSHRFLYAVNEMKEFEGTPSGAVSAFSIDPTTGALKFLNRQPTHGTDPCHLTVDKTGRYVLVANFMSGSVCVLPIREDGSIGEATDVVQHQGSSVDPVRQAGPHAHAVVMDDSGYFTFVPDLGLDKVMVYKFDPDFGKLEPNDEPWVELPAGAGPRQIVSHPGGKYAYVINELNSTVTTLRYDGERGSLREIQTISTLPKEFEGVSTCAELQLSPSGKYLYGSNRGHDSIVIYAIDPMSGMLSSIGHKSTQGKTPRHFMIDPEGAFLLAANQDSDNLVAFKIDSISGELSQVGSELYVPTPVCVRVL
jgi:6-phosphogluconolactonase